MTNVPIEWNKKIKFHYDGKKILKTYKDQNGIERNFSFLKDPAIVDSLFVKMPKRIEALGLLLVIALLAWRLIEFKIREYIERKKIKLSGWDKKLTDRPTTFMMTKKFECIKILKNKDRRILQKAFDNVQKQYLEALGIKEEAFFVPIDSTSISHGDKYGMKENFMKT